MFLEIKKLIYVQTVYSNVLNSRFNYKIIFFVVKLIISTHKISKLIFWPPKRFRVHSKVSVFCSVIFVTFGLLRKIMQNHDSAKILSPLSPIVRSGLSMPTIYEVGRSAY